MHACIKDTISFEKHIHFFFFSLFNVSMNFRMNYFVRNIVWKEEVKRDVNLRFRNNDNNEEWNEKNQKR